MTTISRRGIIRLISYTAALVVALAVAAAGGYAAANRYRTTIEYGYQRALGELGEYISNLDITLQKGRYATSENQLQGLAAKLWREAGSAKSCLEQLPLDGGELDGINKFLSQVGNFCMSLSHRVANGGDVTAEETKTLQQLSAYAQNMTMRLSDIEAGLNTGSLTFGEVAHRLQADGLDETAVPDLQQSFLEMEEELADYPTMIYDGPFSDHIYQQKPRALEGLSDFPESFARDALEQLSGVSEIQYVGETQGNMPCYQFAGDSFTATVSKQGGKVVYFLNARPLGEASLSVEDALAAGDAVMQESGLGDFAYRYYSLNNGVLAINYAAVQDGVILYSDLIKIGIAMDNGQLVSFDANGYLMNHASRSLPEILVSEAEARSRLSPYLTAQGEGRLALIPTTQQTEALCYEFSCTGDPGDGSGELDQVLVYVNVESGLEEQILILMKDDLGVLAM